MAFATFYEFGMVDAKKKGEVLRTPPFRSGKAFCLSLWSFYCRLIVPVPTVDKLPLVGKNCISCANSAGFLQVLEIR